jgi:8-oxo-dGTP pyrophosphatase MutT (NUDIX family)
MSKRKLKRFAGILVKCGNKVLLCKRSPDQSSPNIWSVPGGGIEDDEMPKDTAIREFYEETNINLSSKIKDIDLLDVITTLDRKGNPKGLMYIYIYESDTEIYPDLDIAKDGYEHTECDYFSLMDLPFENHKDELFRLILKNI